MSTLSKRDAAQLVADIRRAHVTASDIASRFGSAEGAVSAPAFVGGIEAVLRSFLERQGCPEAGIALGCAMNDRVTPAEIEARKALFARISARGAGSTT